MRRVAGRAWGIGTVLLIGACSGKGKDDDTGLVEPVCEGLATAKLNTVEATQWPAGLADAIPVFETVAGRWEASSSCGGLVAVKFVTVPRDELLVVTAPYAAESGDCGCADDPAYGGDNKYPLVAVTDRFEYFVETFDDPALDGRTLIGEGALFGPGAPIAFRGCASDDVDPYLQSIYDRVSVVLRVNNDNTLEGVFVLHPTEGESEVCELSGFRLIEGL